MTSGGSFVIHLRSSLVDLQQPHSHLSSILLPELEAGHVLMQCLLSHLIPTLPVPVRVTELAAATYIFSGKVVCHMQV